MTGILYNTEVTHKEFEALVSEVLKSMPAEFARQLDNVEVVVEAWPSQDDLQSVGAGAGVTLYGLYRGVAKTRRANYSGVLPEKSSYTLDRSSRTSAEIRMR